MYRNIEKKRCKGDDGVWQRLYGFARVLRAIYPDVEK
jgi:hypothetical protein